MPIPSALSRQPVPYGLGMLAVAALVTLLLFQKSAITTALEPGEKITVQLARDYKITPYATTVKIAGTKVGVVRSVDTSADGPLRMTLKVHHGTRALLGTEPRVAIRPTTVLGGAYYVQLYPGGSPGTATSEVIPVERVTLPVELDQLLSAIPTDAQRGLQGMTRQLDSTLKAGAGAELNRLLADAPSTLRPAATVTDALRGINKDTDLATLVTNLDKTATVLSATPDQLGDVADSLADTSRVLAATAGPIDRTIATLPATLRATDNGAAHLRVTLDKLADTADAAHPTVKRLVPVLRRLDPAIADARPVIDDLHPLLEDLKPLVRNLRPAIGTATDVLDDLDGPVLDRVNGPILRQLNSEWRGMAPKYPNSGGDGAKFYEEVAYTFAHLAGGVQYYDGTTHLLGFQVGGGSTSLEGTGLTSQQFQNYLTQAYGEPYRNGPPTRIGPALPHGVRVPDPGISPPVLDLNKGPGR